MIVKLGKLVKGPDPVLGVWLGLMLGHCFTELTVGSAAGEEAE